MTLFRLVTLCMAAALFTAGCSGSGGTGPSSAAKPPVAVESAQASPTSFTEGIDVTGSLEPKFAAEVKTQIPGIVKEVFVTEWVRVRRGQLLARIDIAETEALAKRAEAGVASARAHLAQAQVGLSRAEREEARTARLRESGLATQQSLDDARTERDAAQARIAAATAQVAVAEEEARQAAARLKKGMVTAPVDGVIALRTVNAGDLASDAASAPPIFRIVDNRLLNLTVTVPSSDAARVKVGQSLEFTVDSLPGKVFTGRVMYINPELSATDRSLKVVAEVRNEPEILKGGLFAKGRIVTGTRSGVILVPRNALAAWDMGKGSGTLFVIAGDTVQRRAVSVGATAGDQVEITAGLAAGDRYVVRGGFTLKEGDRVVSTPNR